MKKVLRYGMVGGGPGSFIGDAHRRAIALDSTAELVAGVFSSHPENPVKRRKRWGWTPPGAMPTTGRWRRRKPPAPTASTLWWW